jgi:hypothetical protein
MDYTPRKSQIPPIVTVATRFPQGSVPAFRYAVCHLFDEKPIPGNPAANAFRVQPLGKSNKARRQLQPRNARRLTSFIIRQFWLPLGGGVKPDREVNWTSRSSWATLKARKSPGELIQPSPQASRPRMVRPPLAQPRRKPCSRSAGCPMERRGVPAGQVSLP